MNSLPYAAPVAPPVIKPIRLSGGLGWVLLFSALAVGAVLAWQAVAAQGAPDPTASARNPAAALLDIAVLVFREGLECILVLAAITANLVGEKEVHRRPVMAGAGVGLLVTLVTWFIAVAILESLTDSVSALDL